MNLLYRRRIAVVAALTIGLLIVVAGRLFDIQVVRAAALNQEAIERRGTTTTVFGARGDILDRNGEVLATTVMRYDITVSPKNAGSFMRTLEDGTEQEVTVAEASVELGAVLGMSGTAVQSIITDALAADPESDFAYIAKQVDVETFEKVQALGIPWEYPRRNPGRVYPNGAVAGNLLGYVGSEGEALAGLERSEDECLAAENGLQTYVRSGSDFTAVPGTVVTTKPARNGGTLTLTLDTDLQWFAQRVALSQVEATGAEWATATVMDARTGELLAVADVPTVDPNNVTATPAESRGSRAFTAPFEPGSTFKALTAAAVIDAGKASVDSQVVAPFRYITPNGADVNDSANHGDLNLTLTGVLIQSSNTGMSKFGELLSNEERDRYMRAFGVGTKTEVGFLGESNGILNDVSEWDNQTQYTTMFGQGVATTAIQIASIYQTIANDGVRMPVSLVKECVDRDGNTIVPERQDGVRVVSQQAANDTAAMLERVYTDGWLARKWKIDGYRVATKTGTAQVPDGQGGYQRGYLVSVAGFAPADDPRFVVSVSVMNPVKLNSSAASAPVFQQIMSQALKIYRVAPSGTSAPELAATW